MGNVPLSGGVALIMPHNYETCLHDIFKSQAAMAPHAPAVVSGNRVVSYSELDDETDSLGAWLRHQGVSPDDRIGVLMDTCSEYVVACIGALKAGAAFMPLELDWPDDLLLRVLTEAKPRVIITKQQYRSRLYRDNTAAILSLDEDQDWRACETIPMRPAINSDNLAFVPYTSGTTGDPKGVMQTHRAVLSSYFGRYDFSSYEAGDRVACNIFFIWEFLRPLLKGGTVYIIPDDIVFLPRSLTGFIRDNDITEILFTPSILQAILNSADQETVRAELESLRVVWLNGEVVTRRCMEQALNLLSNSTRLFNTYSISETHDVCTVEMKRETWDGRGVCPVGFPMDGVTVRILPEGGATFSPVGTGELHIGGSGLARGYLGTADLDRLKFILLDGERYYSTGDVAEIDSCGMVTITGRNDSMVKIRGYSVYLGGIEETLRKHCDVLDTVVSVEGEDETNRRLMAYVIPKPEATWRVDAKTGFSRDLRHLLERHLPNYMVPSRFLELDELPINQLTGKLDRKALPALPKKKATVSNRMVVPGGATFEERRSVLRELWSEALAIDYISPDDDSNFFDLGGHSLSGLALTLGIERVFGVTLQGTEVYEYQTLNQLAEYLGDEGSSMESEVSLAEDARLDPDVVPSTSVVCERLGEASSVLITGATGFLGAFLLDELLKTSNESTKFYCLTRDKESLEGQPNNRVLDTLRFYGLPGQALQDRIIPVIGDLTKSQFGLSDTDYEHLSQTIDLIFHCAASVNYVYTYSAIKPHTVGGTREVIKFACHYKTKPIQYISSNGIFPGGDDTPYLENNDIDGFVDRMEGGYNQAKWVAERLMWHAMSRGLPVCMFRPGNIGHHSVTGVVNPSDFQTLIIIACLRSGCAPVAPEWLFEMTPVDFLATFVTRIADEPTNLGNVYNIVQQEPVPADQVFTHMKSNSFVTELVSITEWKARLEATAERDDDVELRVLTKALDFVEPYLTDTSTYDNTRFREALSQLALLPPVVDLNYVTKILKAS